MRVLVALAFVVGCLSLAGAGNAVDSALAPKALRVKVVRSFPHDPKAFTQGLELDTGRLLESTGLYGQSSIRVVHRTTGRVLQRRDLRSELFGEGVTVVGGRIIQLTWRENVAPVYERVTLRPLETFRYGGEGWGICFDGAHLITSDGSSVLTFRDPKTFGKVRSVRVTVGGSSRVRAGLPRGPVPSLNELECVGKAVYANVWQTDTIVRIDPATGRVTAVIDASGLLPPALADDADVLNGIAYDSAKRVFLLTGKLWPRLFEVRFVPR